MPHLAATADRIDYWIRQHVVPYAPKSKINPGRDRYVALRAIGRSLKDQFDAVATPIPRHLAALIEQLKTEK